MNTQIIIIVAIVFGGSFLLMIPILMINNKKKKQEMQFLSGHLDQAVVGIYGDFVKIDGVPVKKMNSLLGKDLQKIVALTPGRHIISAKYSIAALVSKKTETAIDLQADFQAGCEYTVGIYEYSPEQRFHYYQGDVGETVASVPLDTKGGLIFDNSEPVAYVICYKETCNGEKALAFLE